MPKLLHADITQSTDVVVKVVIDVVVLVVLKAIELLTAEGRDVPILLIARTM